MLNDPAHPVFHDASGERGKYFYRPQSYVVHLFALAYTRLHDHLSRQKCPSEWHAHLHCAYHAQWVASFAELGRLTAARGVPTVMLIHPVFEQVSFDKYSLTALHEELGQEATRAGFDVIDLLQSYRAYHPRELRQRGDDPWHAIELGHGLAAEAILRYMKRHGYAWRAEESCPERLSRGDCRGTVRQLRSADQAASPDRPVSWRPGSVRRRWPRSPGGKLLAAAVCQETLERDHPLISDTLCRVFGETSD
jgi:hypothetical protein